MSKRIDLTNQTFGDWYVIDFNKERSNNHGSYWNCKCLKCGQIKAVRSTHLRSGASTSCGCKSSQIRIGDKFGFLEVISLDEERSGQGKGRYWFCYCHNCGSTHSIDASNLNRGNALSCGCIKMSKGEYKIEQWLKGHNIKFHKQYYFEDLKPNNYPLKFDFAIFNPNIMLIEYQGKQHYEPVDFYDGIEGLQKQQLRDNQKRKYCLSHSIPLYEISYKDNIISKLEECIYGNNETN